MGQIDNAMKLDHVQRYEVETAYNEIKRNQMNPPGGAIKTLFNYFTDHIEPGRMMDKGCDDCVLKIFKFWGGVIERWKND